MNLVVQSVAGEATCVTATLEGVAVAVDMGVCPGSARAASKVFITHTHVDHIAAVAQHARIRSMVGAGAATYFVCGESEAALRELFRVYEQLDGAALAHNVKALGDGDSVKIGSGVTVETFATTHRVPSQGYLFTRTTSKLRAELQGLPSSEIAQRQRAGEPVTVATQTLVLCVTGDTTMEALDRCPRCYEAKVLVLECTFVGDDVTPEKAHERGHVHLNDIVERADRFQNERIVLMHFSARYSRAMVHKAVQERVPEALRARIEVAMNDDA